MYRLPLDRVFQLAIGLVKVDIGGLPFFLAANASEPCEILGACSTETILPPIVIARFTRGLPVNIGNSCLSITSLLVEDIGNHIERMYCCQEAVDI